MFFYKTRQPLAAANFYVIEFIGYISLSKEKAKMRNQAGFFVFATTFILYKFMPANTILLHLLHHFCGITELSELSICGETELLYRPRTECTLFSLPLLYI